MTTGRHGRKDRLIQEKRHDTYEQQAKWPEPTVCTECSAIYVEGRWSWKEKTPGAHEAVCPACRRIADRYPAGYVSIKGAFFQDKHQEILSLVHNVETQEKCEHPLERIIAIEGEGDQMQVTTTGIHIARRIGEALSRAYKGDLSLRYSEGEDLIRVSWTR